jgi:hypothetical protein
LIDRDDIDLTLMTLVGVDDGNRPYKQSALHVTESPEIAQMLLDKDPELANIMNESGHSVLRYWLRERKSIGQDADTAYERDLLARLDILLPCESINPSEINSMNRHVCRVCQF